MKTINIKIILILIFFISCSNEEEVILDPVITNQVVNFAAPQTGGMGQPIGGEFSKFDFKTYDWRKYSKLERTNIKDDEINMKIWDIAELETKKINETFKKYFIKNSFSI